MNRINIVPVVSGVGGMVSFQRRFSAGLTTLGIDVVQGFNTTGSDALLVIGGTRKLLELLQAKKKGIRIVQRLNGMNWLHRQLATGLKHYLRAEYGNLILRVIRRYIADHVVYQSHFAQKWWEGIYGIPNTPTTVIYNGVDLVQFSPERIINPDERHKDQTRCYQRPQEAFRILMVEGSLKGGYEIGLETAVCLLIQLNMANDRIFNKTVELIVVGNVPEEQKTIWADKIKFPIFFSGLVESERIPYFNNGAHLLYSADINPTCPNAAIEALACGTPVLGFDTGALSEIVTNFSGRVVPYGGDPWQLEKPDTTALASGAVEILLHQDKYRIGARKRAEDMFGLTRMVEAYLKILYQK